MMRRAAAALASAALVIGGLVLASAPADAEVGDSANATGQFLSGTLLPTDLSSVVGIDGAQASYLDGTTPGTSDVETSTLNIEALQALRVDLGSGVSVPLGDLLKLGAVNQYAEAGPNGVSRAASGAVANDGAVDVSGTGAFPASATLDLMQLLPASPVLSAANLSLGAVTGVAALDAAQPLPLATSCTALSDPTQCRDYNIASATVNLNSPLVGDVSTTADTALTTLSGSVNALSNQIISGLLGGVTNALGALNGLVPGLSLVSNTLTVSLNTSQLASALDPVLSQTLVAQNNDGTPSGVAINLATGAVTIDLAQIVDLNDLPPNSTLLSPAVLQNVSGQIAQLLGNGPNGLQTQINNALQSAVNSVGVTIGGGVCLLQVVGCTAGLNVAYNGTLGSLLNGDSPLTITGTGALGVLVPPLLNSVTSTIQSGIGTVVQPLVTTAVNTAGSTIDTAVTTLTNGLSGVLGQVADVAAVNINVQQQNVDGAGTYTEIAAQVSLLNDAGATLNLGKAVVGPNVTVNYTPTLTATSPAAQGGSTTVGGDGWPPDTDVTLQLTDSAGDPVGSTVTVHTDGSGAIPAGTTVPIPTTAAPGDYTVVGTTAGGLTASAPVTVTDQTAPVVAITSPADGARINDTSPTISGSVNDSTATVDVVITNAAGDTVFSGPATVTGTTWSVDSDDLPADGTYTVTATATDPAGNHSDDTSTFILDTTAPAVAITAPADNSVTRNDSPTITGTTDPGASVDVVLTNTATGAQVFAGAATVTDGTWSVDVTGLDDAQYTITATATDAAGNTAQATSDFTVDTTTTVTIVNPADSSTTSDDTPTITGATEPGASVVVTVTNTAGDTVFSGPATVDPTTGNWTIDSSHLDDGDYTVTAVATDPAGNTATDSHDFIVDTTAPPVTVTSPVNGSTIADSTPTVTGTTDRDATVDVVITNAAGDTVFSGPATVDPTTGDWTIDAGGLTPDGTYTVTATATDPQGNSASTSSTFTVDTTAPVVAITSPADGSTINDDTPTVTGTLDDPTATVQVVITNAAGDTVFSGPATVDPTTGAWTIDSGGLTTDGTYTITATATDPVGNHSDDTSTFTLDTTPPPVAITSPGNGATVGTSAPTITGTTEPDATVDVVITNAAGDTVFSGPATVNPATGAWTIDASGLTPDGTYTVTTTATDPAGNTAQATSDLTVDTTAPVVAITSPADGSTINDDTPTVTGTLDDPTATVQVVITNAAGDTVFSGPATVNPTTGDWTVDSGGLTTDGTYTITATATDPVGNHSEATSTFTLDTTPPPVAITDPTAGSTITNPSPPISGTTEPGATVDVVITNAAGDTVATGTATVDGDGNWSFTPTETLPDGDYTVTATATDPAGNTDSTDVDFTIDTTAPTVTISSPADSSTINDDTPTVTGTLDDPTATVQVVITNAAGDTVFSGPATVDPASGAWTIDSAGLTTDGTYTITATATDPIGNHSEATSTFTLDTVAAPPAISSPAEGSTTNDNTPPITGTGEPGATVTVTVDGTVIGQAPVGDDGTWTLTPTTPFADGDHTVTASQTDKAGNVSGPSDPVTFTVDTTAPDAPVITSPADGSSTSDTTPTYKGTGEPGDTVTVTVDGTPIGTATVAADGTWSLTPTTPLAAGDHTVAATQKDKAGNVSNPSDRVAFRVVAAASTTPPPVITSPADGSSTADTTPVVAGTGQPHDTVTVLVDGSAAATASVGADGRWSVTLSDALACRPHTLTATQSSVTARAAHARAARPAESDPSDPVHVTVTCPAANTAANTPATPATPANPNAGPTLPDTGAPAYAGPLIGAGLGFLLVGILMVTRRRRAHQ